jgi:hypothetical protein
MINNNNQVTCLRLPGLALHIDRLEQEIKSDYNARGISWGITPKQYKINNLLSTNESKI